VKTISLKKVSAVAVASLGFGLMSVVPVQADVSLPVWIDTATTVGGVAITSNTSTVTRTLNTQANAAAVQTITAPSGSAIIFTIKTAGSFTTTSIIDMSIDGTVVQSDTTIGTNATAATTTRNLPTVTANTTFAFNLRLYETGTTRVAATTTVDLPVSITVVAPTAFSTSTSTSLLGAVGDFDGAADGKDDEVRVLGTTAGADAASIQVAIKNTSGSAYTGGGTLDVQVISGPGLVNAQADGDAYADGTARADTQLLAAGTSAARVSVTADGTVGTSKIRIRLLNTTTGADLGTIAEETVYFYGAPATVEVAQKYKYVAGNGTAAGCSNATTCKEDTFALSPIAVVTVKDSGGNLVPNATVSASITDATVIAATTITASTVTTLQAAGAAGCAAGTGSCYGLGTYLASVTGASGAASGKTSTVTYRALVSGTTFVTATPVTYTIGGAVATETLALNKSSYTAGEAMTVTRTAKDSAGNIPADGQTANGVTFSKPQGGTAPGASWYKDGVKTSGAGSLFAPVAGGAFSALMTSSVDGVTVITAASSVVDGNAALLTQLDALNAKIVALNALIAKIMKRLNIR
jgi:adhesin/invasin